MAFEYLCSTAYKYAIIIIQSPRGVNRKLGTILPLLKGYLLWRINSACFFPFYGLAAEKGLKGPPVKGPARPGREELPCGDNKLPAHQDQLDALRGQGGLGKGGPVLEGCRV